MSNLAIIPARSGSKRLKNKNIRKIKEKPLLDLTINAAINCKEIKVILLTTDIKNYLQKKFKKVHVINRPKHLASDKSSTEITMLHAIQEFKKKIMLK